MRKSCGCFWDVLYSFCGTNPSTLTIPVLCTGAGSRKGSTTFDCLVTSGPRTHCHDQGKKHALYEQNTWKKCIACQAAPGKSSWSGRSCSSQEEGRGIWQGGEEEEKEDSTLAATHPWLLGSSTWPIYKHVDFSSWLFPASSGNIISQLYLNKFVKREEIYCAAQINYDAEVWACRRQALFFVFDVPLKVEIVKKMTRFCWPEIFQLGDKLREAQTSKFSIWSSAHGSTMPLYNGHPCLAVLDTLLHESLELRWNVGFSHILPSLCCLDIVTIIGREIINAASRWLQ